MPNCAAAPSKKLMGFAIRGEKSVWAPTPRKIKDGKMVHSSKRKKYHKSPPVPLMDFSGLNIISG